MARCDRCERYFTSEQALQQHEEDSSNHHKCLDCNKDFTSARALQQHEQDSSNHHKCFDCNRDFASESALTQHYVQSRAHHYCQHCDDHFDDHSELLEHYDEEHDYCSICEKVFQDKRGLHEHNRQKHFYCENCERVFQNQNNLDNHMRSALHLERTVICPFQVCDSAFVSLPALILHLEAGTCDSGVTRREVDRFVAQTWAAKRGWNGSAYKCFLCPREFGSAHALTQHLTSPAHEDGIYRCPEEYDGCEAEFSMLSALSQHVESSNCGVTGFHSQIHGAIEGIVDGQL